MNKSRGLAPLAAILIFSGSFTLAGCDENKAGQAGQNQAPEVDVVTIKSEPLKITNELSGRTTAFRIAEIRPQVSGIILKRNFKEGSDIKAGASLYQIDPATYQAEYDNAKSQLLQAKADASIAALTVKRYQPLLGTQYISQQDYDQARATQNQTAAAVKSAEAKVEAARINLAWTKVSSPIDGRIGKSSVTEGALVQNGQASALATVQQLDPIYVDVTQSSDEFLRLRQELESGQLKQDNGKAKVDLILSDGQRYQEQGTLEFSDVTVDRSTGSITLRAIFPNPGQRLLPGMFVRTQLEEGTKPDAILVSQKSVARTPTGQATVMIVGDGNKVEIRTIKAAKAIGDKWLVTEGLKEGERVIISGLQRAAPGAQVTPKEVSDNSDNQASSQPAQKQS